VSYTDRIDELGVSASIGTVGDSALLSVGAAVGLLDI
jgi:hypothetical protein